MDTQLDAPRARLSVGFVLLPRFTMLPFAAFVDCLRLAADEGDTSRPVQCRWRFLSPDGRPATASNGAQIAPCEPYAQRAVEEFDYLVVCGGLLDDKAAADAATIAYLQRAAARGVPLIGLCTGPFALIQAGLMTNRRCCVSWYHYKDLTTRYPDVMPVADRLFVVDGDRITCSGGTAAADLAAWLIERHIGRAWAQKSLHIMLIDGARRGNTAQPQPAVQDQVQDNRVRRGIHIIEQHLNDPPSTTALADMLGISKRQLERGFMRELGMSPSTFSRDLRLRYGLWLLHNTQRSITEISAECGFADNAHFTRQFKRQFDRSPSHIARQADETMPPPADEDLAGLFSRRSHL
ncbi:GlxA family transcriptional regulator [Salinisphaera sp. Q1T1-3]|uniref:GlxA family transcriptional regulator n=1 Tax=Salinisphaera sp. Q1T1-3 TaxID=2321229 RepID=UPI000E730C5E|nr:GlxA family transcriptional regulator [Salinisphaera sp. Q1T1-3]RJS94415.1 GlxA family transcriptional regulator [Salinisphaera sp. Q1T1-3]